ncbi:aldose epimerase family protein [Oceanobacillus rekensis]|uniref:aldose epimerase family protein n=1 Tax=Oceanobacillus rekensis TaxID=937927 RepID=UPI000B43188B|nr:aldose epimerase family protein [Oceanobacillus rekensis]
MKIKEKDISGKWNEYMLTNDQGMAVSILNYGGIITKIMVPDRNGNLENVVIGYKNYQNYEQNPNYFGALIGRVAGRIAGASFVLDGEAYHLETNDGRNHLHGGSHGFHQVIWHTAPFQTEDTVGLKLTHQSADGEGNYPGNVKVTVTYTLNNYNQLTIDYAASTDKATPLTLTNHSYFNLSGNLKNTIEEHHLAIDSRKFVELDQELIPTGRLVDSTGTLFDFRDGRVLGEGLQRHSEKNHVVLGGYDHYFIFDHKKENSVLLRDTENGRRLTVKTNQPGMIMYTANDLEEGIPLTEGISRKHLGVCFETQGSPASLHHDGLSSIILKPEEDYSKQTLFSFDVEE